MPKSISIFIYQYLVIRKTKIVDFYFKKLKYLNSMFTRKCYFLHYKITVQIISYTTK